MAAVVLTALFPVVSSQVLSRRNSGRRLKSAIVEDNIVLTIWMTVGFIILAALLDVKLLSSTV